MPLSAVTEEYGLGVTGPDAGVLHASSERCQASEGLPRRKNYRREQEDAKPSSSQASVLILEFLDSVKDGLQLGPGACHDIPCTCLVSCMQVLITDSIFFGQL